MKGYIIYEKVRELVDEFDPDEITVERTYKRSDVYLDRNKAEEDMKNMKPTYYGNPISCYSRGIGFYIEEVNIIDVAT